MESITRPVVVCFAACKRYSRAGGAGLAAGPVDPDPVDADEAPSSISTDSAGVWSWSILPNSLAYLRYWIDQGPNDENESFKISFWAGLPSKKGTHSPDLDTEETSSFDLQISLRLSSAYAGCSRHISNSRIHPRFEKLDRNMEECTKKSLRAQFQSTNFLTRFSPLITEYNIYIIRRF